MDTRIGTDITEAADLLEAGALVAIPTETVYGLAANALDPEAVIQIFEAKNRPHFDPLIVHVQDAGRVAELVVDYPETARQLAEAFWPGPLTLLLPRKPVIPDLVTSGLERVALRVPAHPMVQSLLKMLPFPLAAPSANPFGYVSPTTAQHVMDQLGGRIPYILDGGACTVGVESTIVGFESGRAVVHRFGGIAVEAIEAVAGEVEVRVGSSSNPAAPGMLHSHYAPGKKVLVGDLDDLLTTHRDMKVGVLSFREVELHGNLVQVVLSRKGDLAEAAQNLFAALRQLDESDVKLILAEPVPEEGLGRAINDRLRRASA